LSCGTNSVSGAKAILAFSLYSAIKELRVSLALCDLSPVVSGTLFCALLSVLVEEEAEDELDVSSALRPPPHEPIIPNTMTTATIIGHFSFGLLALSFWFMAVITMGFSFVIFYTSPSRRG
jgi:hypothetical protein